MMVIIVLIMTKCSDI